MGKNRGWEMAILAEARIVFINPKLLIRDIQEWSSGEIKPYDDTEVVVELPQLGLNVAIKKVNDKR